MSWAGVALVALVGWWAPCVQAAAVPHAVSLEGWGCETFRPRESSPRARAFQMQIGDRWPRRPFVGFMCLHAPEPMTPYTGAMRGWLVDPRGHVPCTWSGKWYRVYGDFGHVLVLEGTSTCRSTGVAQQSSVYELVRR